MSEMEAIRDGFRRRIKEKRDSVVDAMTRGRAADHADYRNMVGLLQGLEYATNVIEDLAQRIQKEEDDVD